MGLLDDIHQPFEIPQRATVSKQARQLLKAHTTKRSKKKKKPRDAKWLRKVAKAKEENDCVKQQFKERAQMFSDFKRLIEKE